MGQRADVACASQGEPLVGERDWLFGCRYRVVRRLKKAEEVETLLAADLEQGGLVVIKTTPDDSYAPAARIRLEHEAVVLRQLRSEWLSPLLDFGQEAGLLYLVMPYLAGHTLEQRLQRGPLPLRDALTVGLCLLKALREAHAHGVLHRDLKPANILVNEGDPLEKATLIDFGLARSGRLDASVRDQAVGTARYVSPEQAGLLDHGVDERSDLYAAGVVLFECLAGRPPFEADNVGELLREHLTARPPELRGLGIAVPRALDEVVQRLLRKDPRDRYQSAEAVLEDLEYLAGAVARGVSEPVLVVGRHDRRRTLTEPAFVGRAGELAALDGQLERARAGQGGLVFVEALSGGGKTRLLGELAQRGARQGVWVLRGQGLDQVGQRPFQALAGVVEGVVEAVHARPGLADSLRVQLGEQAEAVCSALPGLAEALGVRQDGALGPESFGQARSLEALTALLSALGSPERPALVLMDDCQWSDELTLRLVRHWQRRRSQEAGPCHLMLVVAYRSEELAGSPHLRGAEPALHLQLPPFGPDDVRLLAESMAGPLPAEALEVVQRFSEGSPFLAAAVLQGLVESEAVVQGPAGWRVEPSAMADVQSSRHAATFLARRVQLLPPLTLSLLSAGAVLGKEFDLGLAAALAGQAPAAVAALEEGRRRHIVWACPQEARYAFLHDKLRQTLLERLDGGERRELHRQAALHLERQAQPCPFQLAYHFDAAGQSLRALPFALAAAEQARAQHSLQVAEQQYRIAERGAQGEAPSTRARVAEGLADVLMLQGRYDEARPQLQAARELAGDRVVQVRVEGKLGELAFKRGDMDSAIASLEQGLRLLGQHVPRWSATCLVLCCWEVLVQLLHSLLPRLFLARRPLAGAGTELLVVRLLSRLAYAYWFERGRAPCLWAHLREMNLAERYPPTPELAQAYSEHAPVMSLLPWFRRGIAYAERSLAIRRALNDPWGQGQSLHFHGVVLYAASRFSECIDKCREAVRLLRRTGDFWEVNIARYQIAASLYRLGDLEGARAEARGIHQSGLELGDGQASGISLDVWAWSSEGKVPPELIRAELERRSKDAQRTAQVLVAQGVQLLGDSRPADAVAVLEQAHRVIRSADVRNAWVSPVLPWLATALRRQLEPLADRTPERRRTLERRLAGVVRGGLRMARRFRNDLPHALREAALLAARHGRLRRARRLFDESLAVAQRQGARHEHAQSLLARGQVGMEAGWPTAADEVSEAERLLASLQVAADARDGAGGAPAARPVTLSLADRFDALLDVGRRLASSLTREAITSAVREAGLRLLRGEHCTVLDVTPEQELPDLTVSSSAIDLAYSRAMVERALARGRAVAFIEGLPDSTSESLLLSGMRSSLAAPILVRGRPAACFHVTHRQVARLFGPDEERLADFIATLASAAMDNAENFAELRRLNESLELRIRERKEAEQRIREQAALLDKAQDAIVVLDLDGRVLYWNQSAERLYGWPAAEALGRSAAELFRGPADQLETASAAAGQRGEWTGEMQQLTRAGERITVESRWTLVRDDAGRPTSRLLVNTDVTERKKVESQLHRAQRMESIGTLAGGIAHDLNNMLAPILMATDLIRGQNPDAGLQPFLEIIQSSAERGAAMVRQILSFARGAEGQRVMVQLKHLVRDLEKVLGSTFPKSIVIETYLPHDVGVICGDATQLYQVLMNLCVNARDAMPAGGKLTIGIENRELDASAARLQPGASPGRYVVLHVTDSGTGIPPEVLERIFDPFFTTKELGKGTGLGLSTVVGIVRGHNGFVTVASEVGAGTTFSVYLPAAAEEAPARAEGAQEARRGQGELILVVDDEAPIRRLISATLEGHGYRVVAACEGDEALRLYAEHAAEVRLLLTDMMMPGMDGPATIRALREVAPSLPVLVTSGFVDPAGQALLTPESGVRGFLSKPFTAEQLLTAVSDALRGA